MANTIFYIILAITVFDFVFEQVIDYLNTTRRSDSLPDELKGIYDDEKYRKQQEYEKVNHRFGMVTSSFSFSLIMLMLIFGGFAFVNNIASSYTESTIVIALIFFGIIGLASDLITTPFSLYDTFVIEQRFGFNKTTPKLFVFDKLKGWMLSAILGGGVLSLIVWIWQKTGDNFWLWTWAFVSFFSIFMAMFYSNLIVPLFNKQKPLDEGELKDAIVSFSEKAGFKLNNIYVIDGSKRSTKANAYFTGLGPKKRIVLYDTLINDLTTNEIVAVLAHEIGHYKKKHVLTSLAIGIAQTGLMLYIFSLLVNSPELSAALGVEKPMFHIGLITFGILYSPLSFFMDIALNMLSRKNEYQADEFAKSYGLSDDLISSLKKLSVNNLSNLTPHPVYVFFHYSHPTLLQRMKRLNKLN